MAIKAPNSLFRIEQVEVSRVEMQPQVKTEIKTIEVIKEVEKIVYQDDPSLLLRLNEAYKDIGKLKEELAVRPQVPEVKEKVVLVDRFVDNPEIVQKLSIKEKVLELIKKEPNYLQISIMYILGALSCYLILK